MDASAQLRRVTGRFDENGNDVNHMAVMCNGFTVAVAHPYYASMGVFGMSHRTVTHCILEEW